MVLASKGKGCKNCKKVKVKCSLNLPTCNRCERLNRECSYPEKYTFVEESRSLANTSSSGHACHISAPAKRTVSTFITEQTTKSGALVQKWHRTTIVPEPKSSPELKLSYQLAVCLENEQPGTRMSWIGTWLNLIPQRIGLSRALDDSVQLIVTAHDAILHVEHPSNWIDARAYDAALKSLREALMDPIQCSNSDTLAAVAILYFLELLVGWPYQFNTILHAGGIARLLEFRGPLRLSTDFEIAIARHVRGPIVGRAVSLGIPCFLTSPRWAVVFGLDGSESEVAKLLQTLTTQFMFWSELALQVHNVRGGEANSAQSEALQQRLTTMWIFLTMVDARITELLASSTDVEMVQSIRDPAMFDTVYQFKNHSLASLVMLHATYVLLVDRMSTVVSDDSLSGLSEDFSESPWKTKQPHVLQRIYRAYEYAWKLRPLGSACIVIPLTMAFPYGTTALVRDWILRALNDLDEHLALSEPRYSAIDVFHQATSYVGEASPMVTGS